MSIKWNPFNPGVNVGGVKILRIVAESRLSAEQKYSVVHECCGEEKELTHAQIKKRIDSRSDKCRACSNVANGKKAAVRRSGRGKKNGVYDLKGEFWPFLK